MTHDANDILRERGADGPREVWDAETALKDIAPSTAVAAADHFPAEVFDPWSAFIVPDFPLHALPQAVSEFVDTESRAIGCDPTAVAMAALTNFSAALDHRFSLRMTRHTTFRVAPRLWTILVGDPSTKKSPAIRAAIRDLEEHENRLRDEYDRKVAEYDKAKKDDQDAKSPEKPPRHIIMDTTIEKVGEILSQSDRGALLKRDELVGWIGSMDRYNSAKKGASADRPFWLEAFEGGSFTVDRVGRGEMRIRNLSVSIIGGMQPEKMKELHGLTSDGLLQRFIPVMLKPSKFPEDMPTHEQRAKYARLTADLLKASPTTMHMSDDAYDAAEALRRQIHDLEQVSGGLAPGFQAFVGKLTKAFGSIALILHMLENPLDGGHIAVSKRIIESAATIIEDFVLPHAFEFYRTAEIETDGDRLQRVASYILTNGKSKTRLLASDLTRNVACFRGQQLYEVNRRLSPLVAGGWLTPLQQMPAARAWEINPIVFEQLRHRAKEEERRKQALAAVMNSPRRGRAK